MQPPSLSKAVKTTIWTQPLTAIKFPRLVLSWFPYIQHKQLALTGQDHYDKDYLNTTYETNCCLTLELVCVILRKFPELYGFVTCTITRKLARWFATVLNNLDLHIRKSISVTLKYGNYTSLLTLSLPTRQHWIWMFDLAMVVPGSHSMQARWILQYNSSPHQHPPGLPWQMFRTNSSHPLPPHPYHFRGLSTVQQQ